MIEEHSTYFSGNPLNRLSFLREDYTFLHAAAAHESARFIPLQKLNPLIRDYDERPALAYLSYAQVSSIIDDFGVEEKAAYEQWKLTADSPRPYVNMVFVGVDESDCNGTLTYKEYAGRPYFAIDVTLYTHIPPELSNKINALLDSLPAEWTFQNARMLKLSSRFDAPVYSQSRMYIDWLARNLFCGSCGSPLLPINGGCKLLCANRGGNCVSHKTISNLSFPRTDCVVIVAVLNRAGTHVLLGLNKRHGVAKMYSCLAGFLEPGESIEDCVRREVFEESGVRVGKVKVHATQPWPYPAMIMMGCIAQAETEEIRLDHDPELEDAQWVPLEMLQKLLRHETVESGMMIPPKTAIAHVLLSAAANGTY
ncbi:NAD-capped RNA hydrolase Npy1p [Trichomonascus vanleenenianus]|uniref:NAD(+) diphosphatase n=1 Tax=Trichomonascus vanleenenianus TaxID=2268995 RepID=UPI003EC9C785